MSVTQMVTLGVAPGYVNADTGATPNTIVMRDNQGGTTEKNVTAQNNLQTQGQFQGSSTSITSNTTLGTYWQYFCNATGGAITLSMPAAAAGLEFYVMKTDAGGNAINFSGVLGLTSTTAQYKWIRISSDGTNWYAG